MFLVIPGKILGKKPKCIQFCIFKEICSISLIVLRKVIYLASRIEQYKN